MLNSADLWRLPDGVNDTLPADAHRLEQLRRHLLDELAAYGYQLVYPPFIEYTTSLLANASPDLEDRTFKLVDPHSGRLMGIRADMTPQVARIDTHVCPTTAPARYCYAATVLHAQPQGLSQSRTPLQLGAELFGVRTLDADLEIIDLMLRMLSLAGVAGPLHLDLGHVGLFWRLAQLAELSPDQEQQLFDIYQRKSLPDLRQLVDELPCGPAFLALGEFTGDLDALRQTLTTLLSARTGHASYPLLLNALDELAQAANALRQRYPDLQLGLDVSELRGYHYHTGLVFAAYVPELAMPVAQGGRYDEIGLAFGRARPATGFSCDLQQLLQLDARPAETPRRVIGIRHQGTLPDDLQQQAQQWRQQGHAVLVVQPEQVAPAYLTDWLEPASGTLQPIAVSAH